MMRVMRAEMMDITDRQLDEWQAELTDGKAFPIAPGAAAITQGKMAKIIVALIIEVRDLRKRNRRQTKDIVCLTTAHPGWLDRQIWEALGLDPAEDWDGQAMLDRIGELKKEAKWAD